MYPTNLKYLESHQWAELKGDVLVTGISVFAGDKLGDITGLDLPSVGDAFEQMQEVGGIEFGSENITLHAPLAGEVIAINTALINNYGAIVDSPYEDGWFFKVKIIDPVEMDELMTVEEYENYLSTVDASDEIDSAEL
ncbi:glycine cleavage system protein H [Candidatus Margulisiibacteriota bacterium]